MNEPKPSYEELQERLARADTLLGTLRRSGASPEIGTNAPTEVRIKSLENENERLVSQLETTFDSVNDAIWILDADQRVVRSNRAAERLFHRPADDMTGKHCWEIVHETADPFPGCQIMRMHRSFRRERMDLQVGERWFEVTVDPILDVEQHLVGAVHIISDITDRVLAQEQLRRQNEKLALLLEIVTALAESHETHELLQIVADGTAKLLPSGSAATYLLKGEFIHLETTSPKLPPGFPDSLRRANLSDHPHIRQAIFTGMPVVVDDIRETALSAAEKEVCDLRELRSLLYIPLAHKYRSFGVLIAGSANSSHRFSDEVVSLFRTLAGHVSLEIEGVRLEEENQRHITNLENLMKQQQQAENALREREALFRNLFQKHAAVKLLIDPDDGHIVDANEAAAIFYGWTKEELRRMKITDINTLSPAQVKAKMEKARTRTQIYFEFKHRRADGSIRDVAVYSSKIESSGKDLLHSIIHDITKRKRIEAERERLITAVEQTGEVVMITDFDGTIQYVNPAFTVVTGYSREEATGRNPRLLNSGKQDQAFFQNLWKTITEGRIWQGRLVNKRKDGTLYSEFATISPVVDGAGRIINFVAVKRDITEQLRIEEERTKLQEQLQQAQKLDSVGRLAGGVAHDFNNMLSIILGYGESVLDQLHQGDPLREDVRQIVEAGQRSASLTRQLLAFSRKQPLQPKVLDLNVLVRNLDKMLRRLIGEDIELKLTLAQDVGKVLADPGQIDQVILNLVVNSRDAMPRGGKLLIETASVILDDTYTAKRPGIMPGKYVLLAVTDTGCGMNKEIMGHIFDPFFTTKEKGRGTGLGLSMVYGIVKQSGGTTWVYSEPGQGTTFKIFLPQADTVAESTVREPEEVRPSGGGEHILVVEDEEGLRKLMASLLSRLGYTVTLAANGGEALLLMEEDGLTPDLIITDVIMPNMNGKQLIDVLRRSRPHLKALYMSGYTDNAIVHRGVLDQGTLFIQKPFNLRDIAEKVRTVLRGKGEADKSR